MGRYFSPKVHNKNKICFFLNYFYPFLIINKKFFFSRLEKFMACSTFLSYIRIKNDLVFFEQKYCLLFVTSSSSWWALFPEEVWDVEDVGEADDECGGGDDVQVGTHFGSCATALLMSGVNGGRLGIIWKKKRKNIYQYSARRLIESRIIESAT